jgi:aspartate/methionine/tyrosine aminotransferase
MRGEPDFDTPAHIAEAAIAAIRAGRTRYPDNRGELKLREAIAAKLLRDNQVRYDPAGEILVTTGATLGIHSALTALLEPGDEVIVPEPIYDAYQSPIRLAGGQVRFAPSTLASGRFTLSMDALAAAVTPRAKVLLLNTPWNPVGTVLTRAELTAVAEFVLRHDLTLVSDEIYEAITYDGSRHVSPASLGPDVQARTIVINSLSKTYAMTGWRAGYCAGPAATIQQMFLALQQSSRGPATFVQDAAAVALAGSQACVETMRAEYARRRQQVIDTLREVPRVRVLAPEGGFFAMVDVRELGIASSELRRRLLHDAGVSVVHGAAYGPSGEGTLRVSFGSGGQALTDGLQRLRDGLQST